MKLSFINLLLTSYDMSLNNSFFLIIDNSL